MFPALKSFDELFKRDLKVFQSFLPPALIYRVQNTVFHVVFEDKSAGLVKCCSGRRYLDQDFTAVSAGFNHRSDAFDLAFDPGKSIENTFVQVRVCVGHTCFAFLVYPQGVYK
jgi:hypothetical protein